MISIQVASETDMLALGDRLAQQCVAPAIIFLQGPLGAGKTTLARGFLQSLGHAGPVKSPTYTIVEHYDLPNCRVHHFDLYRLEGGDALFEMGFEDYLEDEAICIIEWPEKAQGFLPRPLIYCKIEIADQGKTRIVEIEASTMD